MRRPPRALAALLVVLMAMAGCVGKDDPPIVEEPPVTAATAQDGAGEPVAEAGEGEASESSPPASAPPAPAANETPAESAPAAPTPYSPPPPPAPRVVELRALTNTTAQVGTPCAGDPAPCRPGHDAGVASLPLETASPAQLVILVNWTATQPAAEKLWVNVTDQEGRVLLTLGGASPLAGEIAADALAGVRELRVAPNADTPGVVLAQPVYHALTLTYR